MNLHVVNLAHIAEGLLQNKGVSFIVVNCYQRKLKYVKDISCVNQLSLVKHVTIVPAVALNLPVGSRLQNFWKNWEDLGAGPQVEGYTLPFWIRPNLAGSPTIISCCANPHRNLCLLEALHQLVNKNSCGVFQLAILGSQTQQPV